MAYPRNAEASVLQHHTPRATHPAHTCKHTYTQTHARTHARGPLLRCPQAGVLALATSRTRASYAATSRLRVGREGHKEGHTQRIMGRRGGGG